MTRSRVSNALLALMLLSGGTALADIHGPISGPITRLIATLDACPSPLPQFGCVSARNCAQVVSDTNPNGGTEERLLLAARPCPADGSMLAQPNWILYAGWGNWNLYQPSGLAVASKGRGIGYSSLCSGANAWNCDVNIDGWGRIVAINPKR